MGTQILQFYCLYPCLILDEYYDCRGRRLDCRFSQSSMKIPPNLCLSDTSWDVFFCSNSSRTKRKRETSFDHHSPSFSCGPKLPIKLTTHTYIYGEALPHLRTKLSSLPTNWRDCISSVGRGEKGNGWQPEPKSCFWKRKVSIFFFFSFSLISFSVYWSSLTLIFLLL